MQVAILFLHLNRAKSQHTPCPALSIDIYAKVLSKGVVGMENSRIIEVRNLRKSYAHVKAVDGVSFYLEQGKLFSFLGPNGAGKSTTIEILCTLNDFDSGEILIGGYDLKRDAGEIRRLIGVVFQDGVLDSLLTVRENLSLRAEFYCKRRADIKKAVNEVTQIAELGEFIDRPYGKLSGGQRRRADIARALLNKPEILFLDEPTTGLDPQTRQSIWRTIRDFQNEYNMTVFLTTHYMEEAAQSDYVIVIDRGEIAAKGTPAELKTEYASDTLRLSHIDPRGLTETLNRLNIAFEPMGQEFVVKLNDTMDALVILEACKEQISNFQVLQGTMDDAFIGITGRELRQ